MAPKKGEKEGSEKKRVVFGRPGNNVSMGIVGLPNVGKSSFFNVITKMSVPAENFPFCTIDPSDAKVPVPDKRFRNLIEMHKPKSEVPAVLTVTDIAGLVRGAAEGQGLGNAFLSHIRAVDGIYHMCRAFEDSDVTHVEESVDPVRDLDIIHSELQFKDKEMLGKFVETNQKNVERGLGGKEAKFEFDAVKKALEVVSEAKDVRAVEWTPAEIEVLNKHLLLTAKPMIYLVNLSKKAFIRKGNKWLPKLDEYVKKRGCGDMIIPFSVEFERELLDAQAAGQKKEFLAEHGEVKTMLPRIIHKGYEVLDLIHFFTAGPDEVKCWTIRRGTLAPKAAGVIHSDFEKGFICAEVMKYDDFMELKTETAVKSAGKMRQEGKQYEVQDGDIITFKFNN